MEPLLELRTPTTTGSRARRLGQQGLSLRLHTARCNSHTEQLTLTAAGSLTPLHLEGHPMYRTLPVIRPRVPAELCSLCSSTSTDMRAPRAISWCAAAALAWAGLDV